MEGKPWENMLKQLLLALHKRLANSTLFDMYAVYQTQNGITFYAYFLHNINANFLYTSFIT